MPGLWAVLGVLSIVFGVAFSVYQEITQHNHWSWRQLVSTEAAVSIALFVGIALVIVALVEFVSKRNVDS